jgi:hypothetical protein
MYWKNLINWWEDSHPLNDETFWLLQLAAMKEDN